jgi:hypothetical protein
MTFCVRYVASNPNKLTNTIADIREAQDALILFEAVRLDILPLITRRLNGNERSQLRSGNIFVWEESESKGGLSRWTDGRRWYDVSRPATECFLNITSLGLKVACGGTSYGMRNRLR